MKNAFALIFAILLLVSCSSFQPAPTTASPSMAPTKIIAPSKSPTPTLTQSPIPSSTPTNTIIPSDTPFPTYTQTPLPSSTSTEIPTLQFYAIDPTIVATSVSCSSSPGVFCVSGLGIKLSGTKLSKYEVVVSWPGFTGTSFECPQQALLVSFGENMAPVVCDSNGITFISVGLTELTITINWDGGSYTETLYPAYEVVAPQGPECKPQCLVGKAEMTIP